jgi:hypothetical protein
VSWIAYLVDVTESNLTYDGALRSQSLTAVGDAITIRVRSDSTTAVTPTSGALAQLTRLAVFGNHGLTLRDPGGSEPWGVYASDVIDDVITRTCPKITSTDIEATTYIIPQLAFDQPTTAEDVVSRVNAYHAWRWGVWGREFFCKARASDVVWEARLSDGARPAFEGDDASQVINGVVVTFPAADTGRTMTIGPTGYAMGDDTSASLLDTDESNPCNASGTRRWATLTLSMPSVADAAVQIAAAYLTERNLPSRRGSITLTGYVRHPTEGLLPVSRVRAGDWIRLADLPDDVAREIISVSYNHEQRTATCEVGGQVARLDAILERLGIQVGLIA